MKKNRIFLFFFGVLFSTGNERMMIKDQRKDMRNERIDKSDKRMRKELKNRNPN